MRSSVQSIRKRSDSSVILCWVIEGGRNNNNNNNNNFKKMQGIHLVTEQNPRTFEVANNLEQGSLFHHPNKVTQKMQEEILWSQSLYPWKGGFLAIKLLEVFGCISSNRLVEPKSNSLLSLDIHIPTDV